MGERLYLGELDLEGNLWGLGFESGLLYYVPAIPAGGTVRSFQTSLRPSETPRHLAVSEDGSVWLLVDQSEGDGAHTEALRFANGTPSRRVTLLGRYVGGSDRAGSAVLGRAGPFLWLERRTKVSADETVQDAVFKLNLTTGVFAPQIAPATVTDGYQILEGPDAGAVLKDTSGGYWRIMP